MIPSNRGRNQRPSHKELARKLREATECVRTRRWFPADPAKLKANWDELEDGGYVESAVLEAEQVDILIEALSELSPAHYVGRFPPERSYEQRTRALELFCFCWRSSFFGNCEMFLRLSVVPGDGGCAWIYSLHPARRPCKEGGG